MSATPIAHRRAAALLTLSCIGGGVAASLAVPAHAAGTKAALAAKPSLSDIVKASAPSDWRPLDPGRTLYMELPAGRVVIELAPAFAPQTVANIETLAREHYFDGLAVIRSQDNYVAQWGDADEVHPKSLGTAQEKVPAEFTVPMSAAQHFVRQRDADGYAPQIGHADGMPAGRDPKTRTTWLAHCYGMVGVARDNDADSGNGSGLYAITGHGPRHLDRNITVVGRVVAGMDLLSTLPRGTGPLGFYEKPEQYTPIKTLRLASDVPEAERSQLEVMRTDSATYAAAVDAQRNRGGPWNKVAVNYIDLCNAAIPVRQIGK